MTYEITTRSLRYFLMLARERHFSAAAEQLNVAQSALSQQIKHLEEALGFKLFNRSRPLELTEGGLFYQVEVADILARLEKSSENARAIAIGQQRWLGVGFSRSAMYNFLPPVIRAFRKNHLDVELRLFEMASDNQPDALNRGEIHIGIVRDLTTVTGLRVEDILVERLVVALARDSKFAQSDGELDLAELVDQSFILYPKDRLSLFRMRIMSACQDSGFVPMVGQEAAEIQTALGLVAAGYGVSIVPQEVAAYGHTNLSFRPLTIKGDEFRIKTMAVTIDRHLSSIEEQFLKLLRLQGEGLL